MRVAEAMTRDVCVANPNDSICAVACTMASIDAGEAVTEISRHGGAHSQSAGA